MPPAKTPRRIEYMPLDEIAPALINAKGHDEALITASVARFGLIETMVMDERTARLVAGHGRLGELMRARAATKTSTKREVNPRPKSTPAKTTAGKKAPTTMAKTSPVQKAAAKAAGSRRTDAPKLIEGTDAEAKVGRYEAAKTESAAVKAWEKAGSKGTRPATPNLDYIEAHPGEKSANKTPAAKVTQPTAGPGQTVIECRGAKHANELAAAPGCTATGRWIVVDNAKAQAVFNATVKAHGEKMRGHLALLRFAFPEITDSRKSDDATAVQALVDAKAAGTLAEWTVAPAPSGGGWVFTLSPPKGGAVTARSPKAIVAALAKIGGAPTE